MSENLIPWEKRLEDLCGATRKQRLEELQERHGLEICIHSFLERGKRSYTVYRIIEKEEERSLPIPQATLVDLNLLLLDECGIKLGLWERTKAFLTRKKIFLQFPFGVSPTGLTVEEIEKRIEAWAFHCHLAEISY